MVMKSRPEEIDMRVTGLDLVSILFRRKWSIFFVLVVGALATVVWLWVIRDDMYELTAKVLVKIGYEQATSNTILNDRPSNVIGQRTQDVNSEIDILQNTELLVRVVDRLGLDTPAPPVPYPDGWFARARWRAKDLVKQVRDFVDETLILAGLRPRLTHREKVIATLKSGLIVVPQKESNVFIARMLVQFRQGSSVVLNTLLDEYLAFRLKLWKGDGTVPFFLTQVADSAQQLRAAEEALRRFEEQSDISVLSRQQDVLLVAISDAEAAVRVAELELADARSKVARLEQQRHAEEPKFVVSGEFEQGSFPDQLLVQLSTIQRERERLRMTELDTGVRLQNMKSQFDVVMSQFGDYVRSVHAEKQGAYDARLAAVAALKNRLQGLHGREIDWNAYKRRVDVVEKTYLMYRQRLNEATGVEALETQRIGNVVIVERAIDPLRPFGIRKLTLLGLALLVVLFAALAWVAIAEFLDHGVYTEDALNSCVEAPVIAVVPTSRRARLARLALRRPAASEGA
jgi:uncharacterized protein involved in exopolysaccharide biosynthesis